MRNGALLGSAFLFPGNLLYYIVTWVSLDTQRLSGTGPVLSLPLEGSFFFPSVLFCVEQLHTDSITSARRGKRVMMS